MAIEFLERCDTLEECYEFMLAYAGQGLPSDEANSSGSRIRNFLERASLALTGLAETYASAVTKHELEPAGRYKAFVPVIDRDANDSLAAIDLVLAQRSISPQLIDNLNASIHLRALLTDLFLVGEILRTRSQRIESAAG
jgi:hypothetical protein